MIASFIEEFREFNGEVQETKKKSEIKERNQPLNCVDCGTHSLSPTEKIELVFFFKSNKSIFIR